MIKTRKPEQREREREGAHGNLPRAISHYEVDRIPSRFRNLTSERDREDEKEHIYLPAFTADHAWEFAYTRLPLPLHTHTHTHAHIIGDVYIGLRYTCVRAPADIHGFCLFAFAAVLSPTRASIKNTPRGGFVRALASCRPSIIIFACSARSARQISTALCVCTLAARVGCGSITLPRQRFCTYRTSSYSGAVLVFFFRPSPFFCAPAAPLFFHGK